MKNKANESKKLTDCIPIAQSTLYFLKVEKTKCGKFNFVHLSFFLLSPSHITQKLSSVCEYYTYRMTSLLPGIFLYWTGVAYELRPANYGRRTMASKLSPKTQPVLVRQLQGLLFNYFGRGTYSQATPGLLNAYVYTGCDEPTCDWVSRNSTIVFSVYLALKTMVQPKTLLCIF